MDKTTAYKMLINGKWVESSDKKSFDSINPSTGKVWSTIPEATQHDVEQAVESAQNAFESGPWSKMTPTERGECLRNLGTLLSKNSELLGKIESIDTGKCSKRPVGRQNIFLNFSTSLLAALIKYTERLYQLINLICLSLPLESPLE